MKKEDIPFLIQLIKAVGEAEYILTEAYKRQDVANFDKAKKFIFKAQAKIKEVLA